MCSNQQKPIRLAGRFAGAEVVLRQARRILEYLELPWHNNCLAFYQNRRQVKTAGVAQVRKPIYRLSVLSELTR